MTTEQNGTTRTPPKVLAQNRLTKFTPNATKLAEQLRGFPVEEELEMLTLSIAALDEKLLSLPEDYKPKRLPRPVLPGKVYEIKERHRERYEKIVGAGNAPACLVEKELDEKHVLAVFAAGDVELKAQVTKGHLGTKPIE